MANNYTKFSTEISVFDINRTEKALEQLKATIMARYDDEEWQPPEWLTVDDPGYVEEAFAHITIRREPGKKPVLWVHSDENIDFDAFGCVLGQLIQEEPDDDLLWRIPYADTMDVQRPGGFGGGVMFINKDHVAMWSTESLTQQIERVLGKESLLELLAFD